MLLNICSEYLTKLAVNLDVVDNYLHHHHLATRRPLLDSGLNWPTRKIPTTTGHVTLASSGLPQPTPGRRFTLWVVFTHSVLRYAVDVP